MTAFDRDGVAADYAAIPIGLLAPKPRALSHAECAAMAAEALKTPLSPAIMQATVGLARNYYPELMD